MKRLITVAFLAAAGTAQAQNVPTVDPSGRDAPTPPTGGWQNYGPVTLPPQGAPQGTPQGAPTTESGFYLGDSGEVKVGEHYNGPVPDVHVVQRGDTLWDICAYYFANPWKWPEIWSYNPTITNPHWIYPGDLVRLAAAGAAISRPATPDEPEAPGPSPARTGWELRQIAFVSLDELKVSGRVVGSTEDKTMLSTSDEIYLDYPEGKPFQVGRRYAIYTKTRDIKHPDSGDVIGAYVMLKGEVLILDVKKGKKAHGVLTYVLDDVNRGDRVGTLRTQFKDVDPVPADRDLEGVIVGVINNKDMLIGDGEVVFIDRGSRDGLKEGNLMQVIRRGDAYPKGKGYSTPAGQDDRAYPDERIGEVIIVEASPTTAVGWMTLSSEENLIGDHVVMRQSR